MGGAGHRPRPGADFAPAAAALNRSQSAVSYAVARLQESLGVPLLSSQGRKAVLTPHGETLLRSARPLLQELSTLEDLAHSLQRGWESQLKLVVDLAFPRERLLAHRGRAGRGLSPTLSCSWPMPCSRAPRKPSRGRLPT